MRESENSNGENQQLVEFWKKNLTVLKNFNCFCEILEWIVLDNVWKIKKSFFVEN